MLVTLPLYILRELGRALFLPLMVYSFFVLPLVLGGMLRQNIGLWTVIQVAPLVVPYIAGFILPPTIITGTVICYGRLNNDNEFCAAQAGGIWPGWILAPALCVGILSTLTSLYLNEDILTKSTAMIEETLVRGTVEHIERMMNRQGVVQVGPYHLYRFPRDEQGNEAIDITVFKRVKDGKDDEEGYPQVATRIVAKHHSIEVRPQKDEKGNTTSTTVLLKLTDSTNEDVGAGGRTPIEAEAKQMNIPLSIDNDNDFSISSDRISCRGISELIREQKELNERLKAGTIPKKDYLSSYGKRTRALHSRLALSFSCILFAIAGTLLGLFISQGDRTGRFVAGFVIAAGYFILFLLCKTVAEFSAWILWLPNIVLLGGSFYLWKRTIKV